MPCEYILFMTYLFLSVLSGQMYIPCMKKKHKTHTSYLFCLLSVTMFTNCLFINVL